MAYRFKKNDRTVSEGVRRIADGQIRKALASLRKEVPDRAVHEVRKSCKKLRALIRLVHPAFEQYATENEAFRGIADAISGRRDTKVMQDTCEGLAKRLARESDRQKLERIHRNLISLHQAHANRGQFAEDLAQTSARLNHAGERVRSWKIAGDDWSAIEAGLTRTYARASKAASQARISPDAENFHQLRKYIKYHGYHCLLLRGIWPEMIAARHGDAATIGTLLGHHHDLAVFAGKLAVDPSAFGKVSEVEFAIDLARTRQARIEEQAWPLLGRLLAQPPEALGEHFGELWLNWRQDD